MSGGALTFPICTEHCTGLAQIDTVICQMVVEPIGLFAGIEVEGTWSGPRRGRWCHRELRRLGFALRQGRWRFARDQRAEPGCDAGRAEENEAADQDGNRASRGDASGQEGVAEAGDADRRDGGGGRAEQRMLDPRDGPDGR